MKTVFELRCNNDFKKSLLYRWDGYNEKTNRNSDFASSNNQINDVKALLKSATVKQLFRIQLSKKHAYAFYYFNGLESILKNDFIEFVHSDYTVNLTMPKQYIVVRIMHKNDLEPTIVNLTESGLKQLKKLDLNKGLYSVVWDLLQRYQSRIQGL